MDSGVRAETVIEGCGRRSLAARIGPDLVAEFLAELILDQRPAGAERGGHRGSQFVGRVGHLVGELAHLAQRPGRDGQSCDRRSSCSVTITLPGRVAQVSWITRLRSLLAWRQARSAASSASLAGSVMPV